MALATDPRSASTRVSAAASTAGELFWLATSAGEQSLRDRHPDTARIFAENRELTARLAGFWGESYACFDELLVLAHRAGKLAGTSPVDEFVAAVLRECERPFTDLALASESEESRERILRRLARLRADESLRAEYGRLLRELWAAFEPAWSARRARVEAEVAALGRRIAAGQPVPQLLPEQCQFFADLVPELMSLPGREWVIAVCAFGGSGLVLDLPGLIYVSFDAKDPGVDREQIDELARQLRAIADPTRLSILRLITLTPRRIGDLARELGLSQPTVSNHVKVLRDGGIVRTDARPGRKELTVDRDAIGRLFDDVREVIGTVSPAG